ncbi:hypothetical protein [Aquipseudomonas alcaligenes]|uniref:hypothetical protein n=1 Tax=Aquipseudomonas alcaligenes TaxID=43263 RepID=UPI001659697E|nr:hypothetical protein [Pseudomonas alcaligenes]
MRVSLTMIAPSRHCRPAPIARLFKAEARLGADRDNPLLPEILAFWALWHCRHARPPDQAQASY